MVFSSRWETGSYPTSEEQGLTPRKVFSLDNNHNDDSSNMYLQNARQYSSLLSKWSAIGQNRMAYHSQTPLIGQIPTTIANGSLPTPYDWTFAPQFTTNITATNGYEGSCPSTYSRKAPQGPSRSLSPESILNTSHGSDDSTTTLNRKDKRFSCETCEKQFDDAIHLQNHIRHSHAGARAHPCPECGKAFATSSGLKQHQHIHSSVKPFICEVCHKSYTQFSNLCRHRRMHADCRTKMRCKKCRQLFPNNNSLSKHCRFCAEGLSSGNNLGDSPKISPEAETNDRIRNEDACNVNDHENKGNSGNKVTLGVKDFRSKPGLYPHASPKECDLSKFSNTKQSLITLPQNKYWWEYGSYALHNFSRPSLPRCQHSYKGKSKSVSDAQVQCNAKLLEAESTRSNSFRENIFQSNSNNFKSATKPAMYRSSLKHAGAQTSFTDGQPPVIRRERIWNPILSPRFSSSSKPIPKPQTKAQEYSIPKTNTRAAAAAVAAAYLYCSSMEKKAKSISIANNHSHIHKFGEKRHGLSSLAMESQTTDSLTVTLSKQQENNEPLDLSLKESFTAKSNTKKFAKNAFPHSDWKASLDLFYQYGQRYGSTSVAMSSLSSNPFYSKCPALANMNLYTSDWQKYLMKCAGPYASNLSEPSNFPNSTSQSVPVHQTTFNVSVSSPESSGDQCDNDFSSNLVIQAKKERHLCKYCPKTFPRRANLARHERTHTGEQPYICEYCEKSFSISSNMHRHIKNIHNKERPYCCKFCGRPFGQQTNLDRHLRNHERQCRGHSLSNAYVPSEFAFMRDEINNNRNFKSSRSDDCSPGTSPDSTTPGFFDLNIASSRTISTYTSADSSFEQASPCGAWKRKCIFNDDYESPAKKMHNSDTAGSESDESVGIPHCPPSLSDSAVKSATEGLMRLVNLCKPGNPGIVQA